MHVVGRVGLMNGESGVSCRCVYQFVLVLLVISGGASYMHVSMCVGLMFGL
jgi:hypothetical protein